MSKTLKNPECHVVIFTGFFTDTLYMEKKPSETLKIYT